MPSLLRGTKTSEQLFRGPADKRAAFYRGLYSAEWNPPTAVPAFNVASLSPVTWLDAADPNAVVLDENARVSVAIDKGPNGGHFRTMDAARRVGYNPAHPRANNKPAFYSVTTGNVLGSTNEQTSAFSLAWKEIYVVAAQQTDATLFDANAGAGGITGTTDRYQALFSAAASNGTDRMMGEVNTPDYITSGPQFSPGHYENNSILLYGDKNSGGNTARRVLPMSQLKVLRFQAPSLTSPKQRWIMNSVSNGVRAWNGPLCEFVAFDRDLTPEERDRLTGYLMDKWAIIPQALEVQGIPKGAFVGLPYQWAPRIAFGKGVRTVTIVNGALPPGLSLNPRSGEITGTPTAEFGSLLTLRVTDDTGSVDLVTSIRSATSPWTVTTAKKPQIWIDFSDASTITSAGGLISQANDKSGLLRHLYQPSSAVQPYTGRTVNGLAVADVRDGRGMARQQWGIGEDDGTWFIVFASDTNGEGVLMAMNGADAVSLMSAASSATVAGFKSRHRGSSVRPYTGEQTNTVTVAAYGTQVIGSFHKNGRTSQTRANGGATGGLNGGVEDMPFPNETSVAFGSQSLGNTYRALRGAICEIIHFREVLNLTETNAVGNYLANKWGASWATAT